MDYTSIPDNNNKYTPLIRSITHSRVNWFKIGCLITFLWLSINWLINSISNSSSNISSNTSLSSRLAQHFQYDEFSPIPKNIFQTWKVPRSDRNFPIEYMKTCDSWDEKNKDYRHIIISDNIIDDWVNSEFSIIPEIITVWNKLPKFILKADFFRYLVIFARGGIYSDMDTYCLKSIDSWNKIANFDKLKTGLIIGIEADPDRPDWSDWYARRIQFAQWTLMGKKGHPFLRELIVRIINETLRKDQRGYLNKIEGKDSGGDIMSWTGPGIFTDTLFDYLNNKDNLETQYGFGIGSDYWLKNEKFKLRKPDIDENGLPLHINEMEINYKSFTNLDKPKIFNDIVILPITSFSPGVGAMGSKSARDEMAFVMHTFSGTWKPENERMI